MGKLYFLTNNQNKFAEAKEILPWIEHLNIDLPEIQSLDSKEVIELKLREAQKHHEGDFFVEDISFYLDSLNGLPGPLIKWFLKTVGTEGLAQIADKLENNQAEAKATVGFLKEGKTYYFESCVKGRIVHPLGISGFGWDSIFQPEGSNKTYAQLMDEGMTSKEIGKPRALVYQKLKNFLEENDKS